MATSKKSKQIVDVIELEGELLNTVSYATYYCRMPLFTAFRLFNRGETTVENLVVLVSGGTDLILPRTLEVAEIPPESSIQVDVDKVLNPKYLAELEEPENCTVNISVTCGKNNVCSLSADVECLPIDFWGGLSGNAEMLAALVRPKIADCQKILAEAGLQLKTWGYSSEWSGYSGNDRNAVRSAAAAIFSALRGQNVEAQSQPEMTQPVSAGGITSVISSKSATPLEMALLYASCLEAAKLNPVIILGKDKVAAGVWLYESCFTTTIQDDMSVIEKYILDGVNNLAVFDAGDLFSHKNASFTTSASHFASQLKRGEYEVCVDVKRCRIGGVFPIPIKVRSGGRYELLGEAQFAYDQKPGELIDAGKYSLEKGASKEQTWQRRLLDLSLKNNLLNFRYKSDCIHVVTADIAAFLHGMENGDKFNVLPNAEPIKDAAFFGGSAGVRALKELIDIEMSSGIVRTYDGPSVLNEHASSLIRKARTAEEEAGANTLCLALGFLKWKHDDEKEFKFAPIALLPVTLRRTKQQGVTMTKGEDITVNTTLLEFLKQEFGIDIRGMEDKNLSVSEMIALFRAKTANMKGWAVTEDVYVAQFTFARYAMWSDVKNNISRYRNNPLIASLISNSNKLAGNKLSGADEDTADPCDILVPLPCDSSQFEAVAESARGTTFVLHGPPGTGKSQTITNMIANAVSAGKRVLFVAEKQAALSVVKKRLTEIGIGEFCMEFSTGKSTDKTEIVRAIETTLALKDDYSEEEFREEGAEISETRASLANPYNALHKKRRLGVSVYEGILYYLQNKNAPELVNIESTFYDSLTKEKLESCEKMLLKAQIAAKECGGVYRSPFENVNITECSDDVKNAVLCAAEVVLVELKHLKNYLGLFLDTFNQKISTFTGRKLEGFIKIVTTLRDGTLNQFFTCNEEQFYKFYNANVLYDNVSKLWFTRFYSLPDIDKFAPMLESELENWGENYRSSRVVLAVIKRLNRCAKDRIPESEELEWVKRAYELWQAEGRIFKNTNLSQNFTALGGGINDRKREAFLKPLYDLHALCAQVFMDYNADAFNSVCNHITGGYAKPLINGVIAAAQSFITAREHFINITQADKTFFSDEDIFEYYTSKCGALIDNIDMLPGWCAYKSTAKELNDMGLTFMTDAIESGRISGEQILSSFRKNVYRNFVQTNIPADEDLSRFSASMIDESAAKFAMLTEEFAAATKKKIRHDLISRLPNDETEGPLALELMTFKRQTSGNLKRINLRTLLSEIPQLLKAAAPCMMMSPFTVSQYLAPEPDFFDMVIFDEASQVPTCEAVPSLARAKSAIIVGDPKQLSPTTFFMALGQDEDEMEAEDLDSVLDDCLSLGIPQKHLNWHYRSKHESLIAFSNIMYYSSKLCTFPSPDALDSKVKLMYISDGVYDRGFTKCNKQEAEALVKEVIRRLKDEKLRRSSIGIVTFSTPQQTYIEKMLSKAIIENGLEEAAYEREEPLFVKNLESVQGDERDVIMFSVCYGPDRMGKISLNFGPLNQYGGWRRLNVAVSRAREEMVIYASMRYSMIDLSRTNSRGVAGLKAFLEFAEKGRTSIAVKNDEMIINKSGIGKYVAEELSNYGYECRCDVGVSDFKIDVAVIDPKNKHNFILAILCDGESRFSVKDRNVMQIQTLKRNNWNVIRLYSINFFNNPKREIKKIKEYLDKLCSGGKSVSSGYKRPYRAAKLEVRTADAQYILSGEHDAEVIKAIKAVVAAEEPISAQFIIKRVLSSYGIYKHGTKLDAKMNSLIGGCNYQFTEILGVKYYYRADKYSAFDRYRVEDGTQLRTSEADYSPYDIISLVKSILFSKVSMYSDELTVAVQRELNVPRLSDKFAAFINACIDYGASKGIFVRSISDKISLV